MRKTLIATLSATALVAGLLPASALPFAPVTDGTAAGLTLVYGGCGPLGHRGPFGGCRAGGQAGGYGMGRPCPPGFHLGRGGRRCWPN